MDALVKIAINGGTHFATKKLREWVGYVIDYKENLKNVKLLHDKLINKQKDVQTQVEEGIRKGEQVAIRVKDWQGWADEVATTTNIDDNDWSVLLLEEENRKAAERCCFKLVGWNPKFRHDISLKAEEKINLIKDRLNELDGLPNLTLPRAPPSLGSAGQGDFCQHLKSRQDEVKKIMETLKIVEVNRIGIHGMGGAGEKHTFHVGTIPRWVNEETLEKYAAITVVADQNHEYLSMLNLRNLRLLHLHDASSLCDNYFARMDKIEVLDLGKSCIGTFPSSIEQLRSLRTLLLEFCTFDLEDISRICRLTKLQVLSFRASNINKLSKEIGKLVNLKILDLSDCRDLRVMSAGVLVNLTQLEGLYMKNSFNEWEVGGGGGNMASISELSNCLSLCVLEIDIRYIEQLDFPTNLLPRLSRFKINLGLQLDWTQYTQPMAFSSRTLSSNRDITVENVPAASDLMKDSWKALLKKVERMNIANLDGWWIGEQLRKYVPEYFSNDLQELCLYDVKGIEYALPSRGVQTVSTDIR